MALPPLPASSTERIKLTYTTAADVHSTTIRVAAGYGSAARDSYINSFLTTLTTVLNLITITKVEYAQIGSDVFVPTTNTLVGNTYGTGAPSGQGRTWFYSWTGRSSTTGRKTSIKIFGAKSTADTTYRFLGAEAAWVGTSLTALQSPQPNVFIANDGTGVLWNAYVNLKQGDTMIKKLRGGG